MMIRVRGVIALGSQSPMIVAFPWRSAVMKLKALCSNAISMLLKSFFVVSNRRINKAKKVGLC